MLKQKIIMDLEGLNGIHAEGCPACGKKFSLGDTAVLAHGPWEGGLAYIHENEAVFDKKNSLYYERRYYETSCER